MPLPCNARPPRKLLFLLLPFALLASPAHAEIFKWKDANGVTHYDDRPDGGPGRTVIKEAAPAPAPPPPPAGKGGPPGNGPPAAAAPPPGPVTAAERAAANPSSCKQEADSIQAEQDKRKDMGLSSGDAARFDDRIAARQTHYRDRCLAARRSERRAGFSRR